MINHAVFMDQRVLRSAVVKTASATKELILTCRRVTRSLSLRTSMQTLDSQIQIQLKVYTFFHCKQSTHGYQMATSKLMAIAKSLLIYHFVRLLLSDILWIE